MEDVSEWRATSGPFLDECLWHLVLIVEGQNPIDNECYVIPYFVYDHQNKSKDQTVLYCCQGESIYLIPIGFKDPAMLLTW